MKKQHLMQTLLILIITAFTAGCSKEYSSGGYQKPANPADSFNLSINFTPVVDTIKLSFDSTYSNFWGERYSVSAFKFYVCKFDLINTDSNRVYHINPDKYFLIDAADSTTWSVKLASLPFRYNRVSFLIGVDSIRNVSGAQTGALDPAKGMFWTWSSGYIMAKLEGYSPVSSLTNNKIEYHIGGFQGTENVLRTPTLLFPFGQYSEIVTGKKSTIFINANINAWFYNPHELRIKDNPACTTPGLMAKDISENYSKMFVVTAIVNN
jgi:hypothetical protein